MPGLLAAGEPGTAHFDERDRAFVQACVYGVLRSYFSLRHLLDGLLERPLRAKDADIDALLLTGLYQLRHMDVPAHAAVSATVDAARDLRKAWACSLVNGILRSAQRSGSTSATTSEESEEIACEHPQWLIDACRRDWPEHWASILAANNRQAPMSLRVNRRHVGREAYAGMLERAGIESMPLRHATDGLRLDTPVPVATLPGFEAGFVSVQDEAAQLAAELLDVGPGQRVLDACAAPGGKTAHILERSPSTVTLVALDRSATRLADVTGTLLRLGLACETKAADAGDPDSWWDGEPFDRILLDAPCTATGVIRRHPDIKLRRQAADVATVAAEQQRLLRQLWPLLRTGGRLLYATCSIMREENDGAVAALTGACPDATVEGLGADWGQATMLGRQILPGEEGMDGFYYALLTKAPVP